MTDPERAASIKNPVKVGMTFKEQLAKEEEAKKEYERQKLKWQDMENDLKRREERALEL